MRYLSFTLLFVGLFLFTQCNNKADQPQPANTASIDKMIEQGVMFNTKAILYNAYTKLNDSELDVLFHKTAQRIASEQANDQVSAKQIEDLAYYRFVKLNTLAKETYQSSLNQITLTQQDQLLNNRLEEATTFAIEKSALWTVAQWKKHQEAAPAISSSRTTGCPGYNYTILRNVSNYYNRHCLGYYGATHAGHTDCDYEFRFSWPNSHTPHSLPIVGTTWAARSILGMGGVKGRISYGEARFIVGKGRINTFYPWAGAGGFKNDVKGHW